MYRSAIFQALSRSLALRRTARVRIASATIGETAQRNQINSKHLGIDFYLPSIRPKVPFLQSRNNLTFSPTAPTFDLRMSHSNHVTKAALRTEVAQNRGREGRHRPIQQWAQSSRDLSGAHYLCFDKMPSGDETGAVSALGKVFCHGFGWGVGRSMVSQSATRKGRSARYWLSRRTSPQGSTTILLRVDQGSGSQIVAMMQTTEPRPSR